MIIFVRADHPEVVEDGCYQPSPDRPASLYVREDLILPRLAALAISQAESSGCLRQRY